MYFDEKEHEEWKIHHKLLDGQEGSGLLGRLKEKHLKKLRSRPTEIASFMAGKGGMKMVSILVCRTPIQKMVKIVANLASKGDLEKARKKYAYDDIYHLYCVLTFEDGEKYELQKNDLVSIKNFKGRLQKNSECRDQRLPTSKSFNEVMLELEKKYPKSLYLYQAWDHNCQDFLNKFVSEAGVKGLSPFILQFLKKPFERKSLRKITRFVTDLSASVKRYIFGKGIGLE